MHLNTKAGFGYDNSVSLQTNDVGHVGAAVLPTTITRKIIKDKKCFSLFHA